MSLPWVRLDSHIASHDKVLQLLADPSAKKWQAFASYMCALGWSGDHGTDGHIPIPALPFVHGNTSTARLLVKYGMWDEHLTGWTVRNWAERQLTSEAADELAAKRALGAIKGGCRKNHGPDCWQKGRCSRGA